jgi:hypothetical protein
MTVFSETSVDNTQRGQTDEHHIYLNFLDYVMNISQIDPYITLIFTGVIFQNCKVKGKVVLVLN